MARFGFIDKSAGNIKGANCIIVLASFSSVEYGMKLNFTLGIQKGVLNISSEVVGVFYIFWCDSGVKWRSFWL